MTIEITGNTQWQAWQAKILPPVERVGPGLWSIPVPIPDNPLRYVLVYAIECRDGLTLIDAGWDDDLSWRALTEGIASLGGSVQDVRAVLVTHHHADHLGLAGRIREVSGAWIAMHSLDAAVVRDLPPSDELGRVLGDHLEMHGLPASEARTVVEAMGIHRGPRPAVPDVLLEDGETVRLPDRKLEVIWTPGHSPGHSCFYEPDRRLLFSGDHVLPRITPAIAVHSRTEGDPLADFLRSLDRLAGLDVDEVMPAHEYRFRKLDGRLAAIAGHHAERLAELYTAVRANPAATAWQLAAELEWSRPWAAFDPASKSFALAETVAHLVLLANRGEVRRTGRRPVRWSAV
ncbi:MBL fold metallo-hydrolase [Streptomyces sp. NPDC048590]|uniref:MBL fold metallo-hydrolase n=1 Tax=Streptomyces sp. NPDC048590 TaxID=3365574 RepID=UPI003721CB84